MVLTSRAGLPFLFTVLYRVYALEPARQAFECACCFHQSLSADSRQQAPLGPGWAHELKHDGYRLQMIHVRDGRACLNNLRAL